MNRSHQVNILQGTNSSPEFSRGNTLPLVARPWGMHHWSLQTAPPPWLFHPSHRELMGIRLTHRPSPWMCDYGSMLLTAFTGTYVDSLAEQASAWQIEGALLRPHYLSVELRRYGIQLEFAPSDRGGIFAFTSQGNEQIKVRFHMEQGHSIAHLPGTKEVTGITSDHQGGVSGEFGLHWFATVNHAPEHFERTRNGGYLVFPGGIRRVELRLAGSFINEEYARTSHARELAGSSLFNLAAESEKIWENMLGRVEIEADDEEQERTFYSCLYRCLLFPRFLDEIGPNGEIVHYSPYDGLPHDGVLCADNGFWDTHRTVYPLLSLAYPDILRRILNGWLNACRESGWTPKWSNPGAHDCMIGTHFASVVADAVANGITDWDVESVFSYLWRDATESSNDGRYGRLGLSDYINLGYVPAKHSYSVSRTLDYCYNDFCVMRVAESLGRKREARLMRGRLSSYRNHFDPEVGFMRARESDGRWASPFREFAWGGPYVEGGPWQHSFNVPHDVRGLAELYGGSDGLCSKLETMLTCPAVFECGSYGREIHEMTEMAQAGFGQYAHSNQPVHNYLFLFALLGRPERTDYWVKRITRELYSSENLPGDEDNGEMSAWYVFATLGLYPFCPGRSEFVRFSPLVRSAYVGSGDRVMLNCRTVSEAACPDGKRADTAKGAFHTLSEMPR